MGKEENYLIVVSEAPRKLSKTKLIYPELIKILVVDFPISRRYKLELHSKNRSLLYNVFVYSSGTSIGVQYSRYLKEKPLHCISSDILIIKKCKQNHCMKEVYGIMSYLHVMINHISF